MKVFLIIIIVLVANFSYFGAVDNNGNKTSDINEFNQMGTNQIDENNQEIEQVSILEENEKNDNLDVIVAEQTPSNEIENITSKQNGTIKVSENQKQNIQENKQENKIEIPVELPKENPKTETKPVTSQNNNQQPEQVQVNEEKYIRNDNMIAKIKQIIQSNETEDMKNYGYEIVIDSSIKERTNQFTFTENRVINNIRYSFGTIKIYAEDYYSNGTLIMTECYIL